MCDFFVTGHLLSKFNKIDIKLAFFDKIVTFFCLSFLLLLVMCLLFKGVKFLFVGWHVICNR